MAAADQDWPAAHGLESHYAEVRGARMHYVEAGSGPPVVLLHGNPTSSFLWRNVMPHLAPHARCIAPDLIGMGRSDKPDIGYRFCQHYDWIEAFIDRLGLEDVAFVVHDWGSAIGFHYLARHPGRVRAIAFLEAILGPLRWREFPLDFRLGFRLMRTPVLGWLIVSVMNAFVERVLPAATLRRLEPGEMARYREPFPTIASRRPVRRWPCEIPIGGRPADVDAVVRRYREALQASAVPKLLMHGHPGGIIRAAAVEWCRERLLRCEIVDVGRGIHYLQEDEPEAIGRALADWYTRAVAADDG